MSKGILFPILHTSKNENLLKSTSKTVNRKGRKHYSRKLDGQKFLIKSKEK
jgi:hypothetical protein